jgi:hypothetical protein
MGQTWSVSDDNKVLTLTGWRHSVIVSKADEICEISTFKQLSEFFTIGRSFTSSNATYADMDFQIRKRL